MKTQIKIYAASLALLFTGLAKAQYVVSPDFKQEPQSVYLMKKGELIADRQVKIYVDTNPNVQRLRVVINGTLMADKDGKMEWPISSGRQGHTTPTGTYTLDNRWKMAYSKKYGNSPLPFAQFFQAGKIGIHGTEAPQHLGHIASHGCVRLHTSNAERLFMMVNAMLLTDCRNNGIMICPMTDGAFQKHPSQNIAVVVYNSNRPDTLDNVPSSWSNTDANNPDIAAENLNAKMANDLGDAFDSHDADDDKYSDELKRRENDLMNKPQGAPL